MGRVAGCDPTQEELHQYLEYALEGRRRVKEQMNKRKPDDEFARIDLSYIDDAGEEEVVYCPESRDAVATQKPRRKGLETLEEEEEKEVTTAAGQAGESGKSGEAGAEVPAPAKLKEKHIKISYGDTGFSFKSLFGEYLEGAAKINIEDPYILRRVRTFLKKGPDTPKNF